MTVTYKQARDRVRADLGPTWTLGTFAIDDRNIVENDDLYVFEVGALEHLRDQDPAFSTIGGVTVVYKVDGRVDSLPSVQVAMDPSIQTRPNPDPTFA